LLIGQLDAEDLRVMNDEENHHDTGYYDEMKRKLFLAYQQVAAHKRFLKENPEAVEALGLALDGCIEAWLEHCATANGTNARFEDLQASSTPQSAAVLASRGFCELDDVAIDFTVLGRGESIPTHRARLPGAIVAYERRAGSCDDVLDQAMAQSLLERLRQQPEPVVGTPVAPPREKKDPWAGIKGFGR
jgi:hypothetical protein